MLRNLLSEDYRQQLLDKFLELRLKFYQSNTVVVPTIFCVSVGIGTIVYHHLDHWSIAVSFYFACQVFLGNMYDVPEEISRESKAFTMSMFLWGAFMLAQAISVFTSRMVQKALVIASDERKRVFRNIGNEPVDFNGDGVIDIFDKCYFYYLKFFQYLDWESHKMKYATFFSALCWILVGIMYGMIIEQWDFGDSLFFSLSAMATAGLTPPKCNGDDDDDCVIAPWRALCYSAYITVGVPLFTYTMAQVVAFMVEQTVKDHERHTMMRPLSEKEFNFALNFQTAHETKKEVSKSRIRKSFRIFQTQEVNDERPLSGRLNQKVLDIAAHTEASSPADIEKEHQTRNVTFSDHNQPSNFPKSFQSISSYEDNCDGYNFQPSYSQGVNTNQPGTGEDFRIDLGAFLVMELIRLQKIDMDDVKCIRNLFEEIDDEKEGFINLRKLARHNLLRGDREDGEGDTETYGTLTEDNLSGESSRSGDYSVNSDDEWLDDDHSLQHESNQYRDEAIDKRGRYSSSGIEMTLPKRNSIGRSGITSRDRRHSGNRGNHGSESEGMNNSSMGDHDFNASESHGLYPSNPSPLVHMRSPHNQFSAMETIAEESERNSGSYTAVKSPAKGFSQRDTLVDKSIPSPKETDNCADVEDDRGKHFPSQLQRRHNAIAAEITSDQDSLQTEDIPSGAEDQQRKLTMDHLQRLHSHTKSTASNFDNNEDDEETGYVGWREQVNSRPHYLTRRSRSRARKQLNKKKEQGGVYSNNPYNFTVFQHPARRFSRQSEDGSDNGTEKSLISNRSKSVRSRSRKSDGASHSMAPNPGHDNWTALRRSGSNASSPPLSTSSYNSHQPSMFDSYNAAVLSAMAHHVSTRMDYSAEEQKELIVDTASRMIQSHQHEYSTQSPSRSPVKKSSTNGNNGDNASRNVSRNNSVSREGSSLNVISGIGRESDDHGDSYYQSGNSIGNYDSGIASRPRQPSQVVEIERNKNHMRGLLKKAKSLSEAAVLALRKGDSSSSEAEDGNSADELCDSQHLNSSTTSANGNPHSAPLCRRNSIKSNSSTQRMNNIATGSDSSNPQFSLRRWLSVGSAPSQHFSGNVSGNDLGVISPPRSITPTKSDIEEGSEGIISGDFLMNDDPAAKKAAMGNFLLAATMMSRRPSSKNENGIAHSNQTRNVHRGNSLSRHASGNYNNRPDEEHSERDGRCHTNNHLISVMNNHQPGERDSLLPSSPSNNRSYTGNSKTAGSRTTYDSV